MNRQVSEIVERALADLYKVRAMQDGAERGLTSMLINDLEMVWDTANDAHLLADEDA